MIRRGESRGEIGGRRIPSHVHCERLRLDRLSDQNRRGKRGASHLKVGSDERVQKRKCPIAFRMQENRCASKRFTIVIIGRIGRPQRGKRRRRRKDEKLLGVSKSLLERPLLGGD